MNDASLKPVGANSAADAPLMRIASRLDRTLIAIESRLGEVVGAGHRLADRLGGEEASTTKPSAVREVEPTTGIGGAIGEVENVVMRAEELVDAMMNRAESMINRLTRLG